MNTEDNNDLRVQKTLAVIRKTFEEMLLEMNYEKTTVKELCDRAKINRKTFYRYYPTIDDLLAELQFHISKGFIDRVKGYKIPQEQDKIIREFFLYNATQNELYEKITCSGSYQYVRNKMINNVMAQTWEQSDSIKKLDTYRQNLLTAYVTSSSIEIYKQWVTDGKKVPLEELVTIAIELICQGLYGFSANHMLF